MVCLKTKKIAVSAICQPITFNFDSWTSSQHFFSTTTFAFRAEAQCASCHQLFPPFKPCGCPCLSGSAPISPRVVRPAMDFNPVGENEGLISSLGKDAIHRWPAWFTNGS
jgi:hypothetical protein